MSGGHCIHDLVSDTSSPPSGRFKSKRGCPALRSGILHQEMQQGDPPGRMHGFQLWANLPSSLKMTAPRYQDIKAAEIPEIVDDDGISIRVICGTFWGRRGPVEGVAADPRYLDVFVPPDRRKTLPVETERHAFAYVFEGSGTICSASQPDRESWGRRRNADPRADG
jgi:quercetin 2,3-dioxygenase